MTLRGAWGGALVLPLSLLGCGDESTTSAATDASVAMGDGGPRPTSDASSAAEALVYAPCADDDRVGLFTVELAERFTGVSGAVTDGVVPGAAPEVVSSAAECTLYKSVNLICDAPCSGEETCGQEGTCVAYPRRQDVGDVTVDGLLEAVTMSPLSPGNTYSNPGSLPHPGFEPGAEIRLDATGGEYAPFTLRGVGIAAVEVQTEAVTVEDGQPATLEWTASAQSTESTRVRLELNIAQHGGTPAWITCDVPDTGAYAIPAELVSELYAMGFSGFPAVDVMRLSADSVAHSLGCIELQVSSSLRVPVEIPGLTSCSSDEDCADAEICGVDLTCS